VGSPFIFKIKFYGPQDGAKNVAHAMYIGTRPGADRGEVEIGDRDPDSGEVDTAAGHARYAATRPGSHGLFGPDEEKTPDLEAVQNELRHHEGIVWRAVLSLREDDAVRMGYVERKAWETALRASVPEATGKMGIAESNLRWVAAFHAEAGHPHCHLMFWEAEPKRTRGVLSIGERKDVRKVFIRQLYAAERARLGAEKTALRDLIRDLGKSDIRELLQEVKAVREDVRALDGAAAGVPPRLRDEVRAALGEKLAQIAEILPGKGRVALGFMPPEVKEKVREAADWMMKQPGFSDSVGRYVEIAREMAGHYSMTDDKLEEAGRKAYEDLRDRVSQEILKGAVELGRVVERNGASVPDGIIFKGAVSEARLKDVLDRVTVLSGEDFWPGRASWSRLTENLGIQNPPASPWQVLTDRSGNVAGQVWKAVWKAVERERTRLDARRLTFKRMEEMRRKRAKEQEERQLR